MKLNEQLDSLKGQVLWTLVDERTNSVVQSGVSNALTPTIKQQVANFIADISPVSPNYIEVGTGQAAGYASSNQDTDKDLTSSSADQRLGQGFQVAAQTIVNHGLLWMKRTGTSPGTLTLEIQTDAAGVPSGTAISGGTSSTVSINGLNAVDYDWVKFEFTGNPVLTASTQYHAVLKSSGYTYTDSTTEVIWGIDTSSPGYGSGAFTTYNGSAWSSHSPAADGVFRIVAKTGTGYTALLDPLDRNLMTSKSVTGGTTARLVAVFTAAEAVERIGEIAMFGASTGGIPYAVATVDIEKGATQTLNVYWLISVT